MSTHDLFADLYFDQQREMTRLRDEKANLYIRLTQCESQRSSLLFLVRSTARSLEENHFPQLAQLLRSNISQMEQDYAPQTSPVRPLREAAADPQPDTGSEISPASVPVEAQGGVSQGYNELSREVRLQLWDSPAEKTGDLK